MIKIQFALIFNALLLLGLSIPEKSWCQDPIFSGEMETIEYRLPELTITDSTYWANFDRLIFQSEKQDDLSYGKYFRLFVSSTNQDVLIIELRKYPVKHNDGMGYFKYKGYIFMILGEMPYIFFKPTNNSKLFRYKDYKQPSVFILEDEIPLWIIDLKQLE